MSYTTVLTLSAFPAPLVTETLEELRNSHGSAPAVWGHIHKKYFSHIEYAHQAWSDEGFWALQEDPRLSDCERATFMLTFDRAYVRREDFIWASEQIEAFVALNTIPPNHVNHWPRIAAIFREKADSDIPAIGFWMTSVTENLFEGPYDEDKDEYGPGDWKTTFDVFDAFQDIKKELAA